MKKLFLLALVLAAGVTLSGCWFNKKATQPATAPTSEETAPSKESFSGTLNQLLARGKAVKCTAVTEDKTAKTETEFYIDGATERSRNIARITPAGKPAETTNSLVTKEAVYTWVEGQKEGFLFPVTKTEPEPTAANNEPVAPTESAAKEQNEQYNFNCEAWRVDEAMFALPKGVTFVDQAAQLKDLMKNLPVVK